MASPTTLAVITRSNELMVRLSMLSRDFSFSVTFFESAEECFDSVTTYDALTCFVIDCAGGDDIEAAGTVQVAKQVVPHAFIVVILDSKVGLDVMEHYRKSGVNLVLMSYEIGGTSKLEFITTQIIKASHLPVKVVDLVPDTSLGCPIYYLMPLNRKFVKISKPGTVLREEFLKKFESMGELYIHRSDLIHYQNYVEKFPFSDRANVLKYCRVYFLKLQQSFIDLVLLISDNSMAASFQYGRDLYDQCVKFANDLYNSLLEIEEPWQIINSSAVGDFGSVERGTAVAAYSALLARRCSYPQPINVMIAALFADVGLLTVSPSVTKRLRTNALKELSPEDVAEYRNYPLNSLNLCLARKLPLDDEVKNAILCSHKNMDRTGFPDKLPSNLKISDAAQLVRLAQELDAGLLVRLGVGRVEQPKEFLKNLIEQASIDPQKYNLSLIYQLKQKIF